MCPATTAAYKNKYATFEAISSGSAFETVAKVVAADTTTTVPLRPRLVTAMGPLLDHVDGSESDQKFLVPQVISYQSGTNSSMW